MSFLFSLCQIIAFTSSYVQWINEHIIIPLKANISQYVDVPKAVLYVDGQEVYDSAMYYERNGVNRTFISTVSSFYVKTYTIYYKVTFPTYGISHTQAIIFDIRDFDPPTILEVPSFRITLLQPLPSFTEGLRYQDNYDFLEQINVYVNTTHIVKNRVGHYPIYYQITDSSGNTAYVESTIEVYDHLPPDVTLKQEIMINVGDLFTYTDFFTIKDNYDLFVKVDVELDLVNFNELGVYPIKLFATDQSGNETVVVTHIRIIDSIPPKIILKTHVPGIPVCEEITHDLLKTFILSVTDNYDDLSIDDVFVFHDIDSTKLGSYTIFYHVFDSSYNSTETKLMIKVVDQKPPTIEIIEPFIFDVFSPLPHFIDYIDVSDNYDSSHLLSVKITTAPKMNIVGLYPIVIEVKDLSSNITIYRGYVEIIDQELPKIEEISTIIVTDFQKRIYTSYFQVNDNYSPKDKIVITISDQDVIYQEIGIYPIYVYACDESKNCAMLESEIIILDIESPKLTLHQTIYHGVLHQPMINLYELIDEVSDNYNDLSIHDVVIDHAINVHKIGVYDVIFFVIDSSQNKTSIKLRYKIDDSTKPDITLTPLTLSFKQTFFPMEGVTILEHSSKVSLAIFPYTIDTEKPGSYVITYVATDERGQSTKVERVVTVLPPIEKVKFTSYLPMAIVFVIGVGSTVYFWKKI